MGVVEDGARAAGKPRTVIVTGGGTGIGRAIAREFAKAGDRVAICGRRAGPIEEAAARIGGQVVAVVCDVRIRASIQELVDGVGARWGAIHVLVNNAGVGGRNPIDEEAGELFREIMETNVTGVFDFIQRVLPKMPTDGSGRIINIASVLGKFGVPASSAYCASKHAVIGLTRALALELARRRITVNAVCPGWVDTEMSRLGMDQIGKVLGMTGDQFKKMALDQVPIRRFVEPEEVAAMAFYLASESAAAVTGQSINICGGQTFY